MPDSIRPAAWRLVLHILGAGLAVGVVASFFVAGIRACDYQRAWALLPTLWVSAFPAAAPLGVVAVGAWLAIFRALARWFPGETKRARISTLAVGLLPALGLGRLVNRELLPGFWELTSLSANALLSLAFLAVGWLLSGALVAWHRRSLVRDAEPLFDLGAIVVVVLAGLFLVRSSQEPSGPHIFVLLIDVLRADHLSCYGYERATSPHIDRFAEDAILFERAISASTFTKTSVASLFTGLAPHHHGVYVGNRRDTAEHVTSDVLGHEETTLAEQMKRSGFLTIAFVMNGQLRPYMGFDQGFDLYDNHPGPIPAIAARFRQQYGRLARLEQLFAYLHFLDLHAPYRPIPPYDTLFGRYSDTYADFDETRWGEYLGDVKTAVTVPTEADIEQLRALYDGQLAYVDEWIGSILDALKADRLYNQSLIILTADHGDGFWEHGFIHHSTTPYEELIHVPLLIKLPGSRNGGSRVKTPVGLVDFLPTLVDFVGGTTPERSDGTSLLDMLEDPAKSSAPRTFVSEYQKIVAVLEGRWKLIQDPRRSLQLYDLETDPGERVNRFEEEPVVARRLGKCLAAVLDARAMNPTRPVVVDPETIRELEALGY